VDFSKDGKWAATSGSTVTQVWQIPSWKEVAKLGKFFEPATNAVFSPDSTLLITAAGLMDIWPRPLWPFQPPVYGDVLVWQVGEWNRNIKLGKYNPYPPTAAFSHGGEWLVIPNFGAVHVWRVRNWKQSVAELGMQTMVSAAEFSPDDKWVLTTGGDTVRIWEAGTWRQIAELRGHTGSVATAHFSRCSTWVVTTSSDATARVWETATGDCVATLRGHRGAVVDAVFDLDSKFVVTAGHDTTVRVWEVRAGNVPIILQADGAIKPPSAVFSPDGKLALATVWAENGTLVGADMWDTSTGKRSQLAGWGAQFSPDSKLVITSSGVWETANSNKIAIQLDGELVTLSQHGKLMLTRSKNGIVKRVWKVGNWKEVGNWENIELQIPGGLVEARFSREGRWLVIVSSIGKAFLWDAATWDKEQVKELCAHSSTVWHVKFSPDSSLLVGTGRPDDSKATVWRTATGEIAADLTGHTERVFTAEFSSDSDWIVTASQDRTARVWQASTGRCVAVCSGHENQVTSAAFSPDARVVLTTSEDGTARLWKVSTGENGTEMHCWRAEPEGARLSPDGNCVLTHDKEGEVRLWDARTGRSIAELRGHKGSVTKTEFSADGNRVLIASTDGKARIYSCEVCASIGDLLALAQKRVTRELTPEERDKYLHEPLSK
jgi:WD40 repeat protein